MSSTNWKKAESRLAGFFGAKRRPLSGSNSRSGGSDDSDHPRLYLESKWVKRSSLWKLYREYRERADKEGKTLILGMAEKGSHGILLVVNSQDFATALLEYARTILDPSAFKAFCKTVQAASR